MPGYQELSWAAKGLHVEVQTLEEFARNGWIRLVEKNGLTFIAADQQYRSRFILHLRNKMRLTDGQIGLVLSIQKPPYSAADVPRILTEHSAEDSAGVG